MKVEEALELFKKDFMKITHDEYCERSREGEVKVVCEEATLYFKPKPIDKVFEGDCYLFIIDKFGFLNIKDKYSSKLTRITAGKSMKALQEAINYSKEIKNNDN